jgi:hypothetical protein
VLFIKNIFAATVFSLFLFLPPNAAVGWGFFAHKKINRVAIYLLPPPMIAFFKPNADFVAEHAVDPDKRRYSDPEEAVRHYIDIDNYGANAFDSLPQDWDRAVQKYKVTTLLKNGIVPWHIIRVHQNLIQAFKQKDKSYILKTAAEIGHYISDAHVPLHASSNHNGQLTNQKGIHAFWESRIPELLAEKEFNFIIQKAVYLKNPSKFIWARVKESSKAADTVLKMEKELTDIFPLQGKYVFQEKNGKVTKQYTDKFTESYHHFINEMVERRMQQSIYAVACFWYTAWVDAGQPDLIAIKNDKISKDLLLNLKKMNESWNKSKAFGKICEED